MPASKTRKSKSKSKSKTKSKTRKNDFLNRFRAATAHKNASMKNARRALEVQEMIEKARERISKGRSRTAVLNELKSKVMK